MTQTNQWDTTTIDTPSWGDDTSTTQWGESDNSNDTGPTWGEDTTPTWGSEPEQDTTPPWGATDDSPTWGGETPEEPETETPAWGDQPAAGPTWDEQPAEDTYGDDGWDEDDDDSYPDSPLGSLDDDEGGGLPVKKLALFGGGALAVIAVGVFAFLGMSGGSDSEIIEPAPAVEAIVEPAADPELAQFDGFATALEDALNGRDAEAYYALFSADSQETVPSTVAEDAVKALPSGAKFDVEVTGGSAAGPTAAVKLILHQTLAGDEIESPMSADLTMEGTDWKMVVKAQDK